ncbi:helix-turn-helix domain-containing protein [Thioclava sp. F28-4]|uniref:helix-turn-helix domain-containing protein n=1 Tax=Thioclava sp. F28-4 TaxID=1915315 RepID=UPI001FEE5806|nr:helix-turn-helix transcriptional regulator [Thioclava sp. F28-4]
MFSLTQENLADASGLTVRTIQKVESERHVPEVQTLRSLARGLGFDITVFSKPTPEQEKRQQKEVERALKKDSARAHVPHQEAQRLLFP